MRAKASSSLRRVKRAFSLASTEASVSPRTRCMVKNGRPSGSAARSCTGTIDGCSSRPCVRASWRKRARARGAPSISTLAATSRPKWVSVHDITTPMPPRPSSSPWRYRSEGGGGESGASAGLAGPASVSCSPSGASTVGPEARVSLGAEGVATGRAYPSPAPRFRDRSVGRTHASERVLEVLRTRWSRGWGGLRARPLPCPRRAGRSCRHPTRTSGRKWSRRTCCVAARRRA